MFRNRLWLALLAMPSLLLLVLPVSADCPTEPTITESGIEDMRSIPAELPFMGKIPEAPLSVPNSASAHSAREASAQSASTGKVSSPKPAVEKVVVERAVIQSQAAKLADKTKSKGKGHEFIGLADYYHHTLYGQKTASGQILHKAKMTAAHRTLPFGTKVRVTNKRSGRSCVVVINDRGPFTPGKVIDLSLAAAAELDVLRAGTCMVACTVLED